MSNPYDQPSSPTDIVIGTGAGAFRKSDVGIAVFAHGVKADGKSDDWPGLQEYFNAQVGKTAIIPDGNYRISQKLVLPETVDLIMSPNARILATAAMDKMIETPSNTFIDHGIIQGGILDCNDFADIGLHIQCAHNVQVRDVLVVKSRVNAFKIGQTGAFSSSYECFLYGCSSDRPTNSVCLPGSIGLLIENCSDSHFVNCVFVGNETGVDHSGGNHHMWGVHVWNRPTNGEMKYGFIIRQAIHLTDCVADTPTIYGYWLKGFNAMMVNCRVYMGIWGPITAAHPDGLWDNIITGIYCENDFHTIIAPIFFGSSTTRILQAVFMQPTKQNVSVIGAQHVNVTTPIRNRITDMYLTGGFEVDGYITARNGMEIADALKALHGVRLDGAEGDTSRSIIIAKNGRDQWRLGADGGIGASDAGVSLTMYPDAGGNIETMWFNRSNGIGQFRKEMIFQDRVTMAGTYDKPLWLAGNALWINAGKLMIKSGTPASATDGVVVGTQT